MSLEFESKLQRRKFSISNFLNFSIHSKINTPRWEFSDGK